MLRLPQKRWQTALSCQMRDACPVPVMVEDGASTDITFQSAVI